MHLVGILSGEVLSVLLPLFSFCEITVVSKTGFSNGELLLLNFISCCVCGLVIKLFLEPKFRIFHYQSLASMLTAVICVSENSLYLELHSCMPTSDSNCMLQLRVIICTVACVPFLKYSISFLELSLIITSITCGFATYLPPILYRNGPMPTYDYWKFTLFEWVSVIIVLVSGGLWPAIFSSIYNRRKCSSLKIASFLCNVGILGLVSVTASRWSEIRALPHRDLTDILFAALGSLLHVIYLACAMLSYAKIHAMRSMVLSYSSFALISFVQLTLTFGFRLHIVIGALLWCSSALAFNNSQKLKEQTLQEAIEESASEKVYNDLDFEDFDFSQVLGEAGAYDVGCSPEEIKLIDELRNCKLKFNLSNEMLHTIYCNISNRKTLISPPKAHNH